MSAAYSNYHLEYSCYLDKWVLCLPTIRSMITFGFSMYYVVNDP